MAKVLANPDRLFDRTWRPGHPLRPRMSALRRWGMMMLLLVLSVVIGGYTYLTDSNRIREMGSAYLTQLLGAPVEIGRANLSIFEGLRLDKVAILSNGRGGDKTPLFSAETLVIRYSLRDLIAGRLVARQIIAIDPHVRLTEDPQTHRWNYQTVIRPTSQPSPRKQSNPPQPLMLPEIILRNAQIEYLEILHDRPVRVGEISLEGRLTPGSDAGRYDFELLSRGRDALGPVVSGSVDTETGRVAARLRNFTFGRDIETMLPPEVRQWWEDHELKGRVDIPELVYTPARPGHRASFHVETDLNGVTLAVHPREWSSAQHNRNVQWMHDTLETARQKKWMSESAISYLESSSTPVPIRLQNVAGTFVFTEDGIEIKSLTGRLENNWFNVAGAMQGYSPDAPFQLKVSSLQTQDLYIPPAPRYVNSMPQDVREIYDRIRPTGTCSVWVKLVRDAPGAPPKCSGEVDLLDGSFRMADFPYPLRKATGRIIIGHDAIENRDGIRVIGFRGLGAEGGPNANHAITVDGFIGPLDDTAGFAMDVHGENIQDEPALKAAMPKVVRDALSIFDPAKRGEYPKFNASFAVHIRRPIGRHEDWSVNTELTLNDSEGKLEFFPYPLAHLHGKVFVGDGYANLENLKMSRGDAAMTVTGKVTWMENAGPTGAGAPPAPGKTHSTSSGQVPSTGSGQATTRPVNTDVRPDIHVVATNVPIDRDLLDAMPPDQRVWLEKLGAGGRLDFTGHVFATTQPVMPSHHLAPGKTDVGYDFGITLHDGSIHPPGGTLAMSGLTGQLRLTPTQLEITKLACTRGAGDLTGHGLIAWGDGTPRVTFAADAHDLMLDDSLYQLLPKSARDGWDEAKPQGSVDMQLTYAATVGQPKPGAAIGSGGPGRAASVAESSAAETAMSDDTFRVSIQPRDLSITPKVAPYRLDHLTGSMTVTPDKVELKNMVGHHGDASIGFSGTGTLGTKPVWDFHISGRDVLVDDELMKAAPETLSGIINSVKLRGKASFDFSKLQYRFPEQKEDETAKGPTTSMANARAISGAAPATRPKEPDPDVDFAVNVAFAGASMDLGMPVSDLNGGANLAGTVRAGRLASLRGDVSADSLSMAGRHAKNFRATLAKTPDQPILQISKVQAGIGGGELGGQAALGFPDDGPARYAMNLVVRNVDVQELVQSSDKNLKGRLTASLSMEGSWDDPFDRRGRGDVQVIGENMYQIPVMLGLLQITNLALPISKPYTEADCRYGVEGKKVAFESIAIKGAGMTMNGSGTLDFDTRKVRLSFTTDNAAWASVPLVGQFLDSAKKEMLRIHVNGSLENPKVTASAFDTITTTVDEVIHGDGK